MSRSFTRNEGPGQPTLRVRPRRGFELTTPDHSEPPTPEEESAYTPVQTVTPGSMDGSATPSRSKSILNLTSSTLFGIYQPNESDRDDLNTPWGTGAETPADGRVPSLSLSQINIPDAILQRGKRGPKLRRKISVEPREAYKRQQKGFTGFFLPLLGRNIALFLAGVCYGLLITNLHDRQGIAPVKIDLNRSGWKYLLIWGLAGTAMGQALPWVDAFWAPEEEDDPSQDDEQKQEERKSRNSMNSGLEGWMSVIRSISAFVGIAFAIRKLPWQSTLQLSLTLALSNPAVWYLIDRSPPGFIFSTVVAFCGTAVLISLNPDVVPSRPLSQQFGGYALGQNSLNGSIPSDATDDDLIFGTFKQETVGAITWIVSVLFVSSVCFGNIGRRLAS